MITTSIKSGIIRTYPPLAQDIAFTATNDVRKYTELLAQHTEEFLDMKCEKRDHKIWSIIITAQATKLFIALALFCSASAFAQSITVSTTDYKQTITMMGGDMERSGGNLQRAVNKEEIIDWFVKDMPLNTWRVRYDKRQEYTEGDKNFDFYANDLATMKMIRDSNPDIKFFATMKSDYHGFSEDNHNNLPTFIYDYAVDDSGVVSGTRSFNIDKYAIFLADYVEYMSNQQVPISYLTTSKEWVQVVTPARAKATIERLRQELTSRGVEVPLFVEAGTWSISQGINTANAYASNGTNDYMYGYSSHNLWSGETKTWAQFATAANSAGKPAFHDESGHGGGGLTPAGDDDIDIARTISSYIEKTRMYNAGLAGELFFEVWPRGVAEVRSDGSYFAKPVFFNGDVPGRRMRSYYVMKQFASNVLSYRYIPTSASSSSGLHTMAFRRNDEIVLWVLNDSTTAYPSIDIDLDGSSLSSSSVDNMLWTNSTPIAGSASRISASGTSFSTRIDATSINSFIFNVSSDACAVTEIAPFYKKNSGSWTRGSNVSLDEGDSVSLGPWPNVNNGWSWTGPDRFTASTREVSFTNMSASESGNYVSTYTSSNGCTSSLAYDVSVVPRTNLVHMRKRNATDFAIDGGRRGADGQNVSLWSQNQNNVNQQWLEIDRGDDYYSYQKEGTNYCIDGQNGGVNGQNTILWTCNANNRNQHWKKIAVDGSYYRLEKRNSPAYSLDGGGNGGENGQNVYLWRSSNVNENQHWWIQ